MKDLRKDFDNFAEQNFNGIPALCPDGQCDSDEEADLQDYPSYTDALYAKLIAPHASGIYISRWDLKEIALAAGDSMAIHPRKRMFELLMPRPIKPLFPKISNGGNLKVKILRSSIRETLKCSRSRSSEQWASPTMMST